MNPMVRKELQQRMRERRGWVLPALYIFVLAAVVLFTYYTMTSDSFRRSNSLQGSEVGVGIFLTTIYAQLTMLLLIAPVFSAGSITIEKEQKTLGGLLTSLLSAPAIWWGKFVSSLLFVLLLVVSSIPVLSLVFAFGGVGPIEVGMAVLTTIIILTTVSSIGLFWSSLFRRTVTSTAVSYGTVVVIAALTAVLFLVMQEQAHSAWRDMRIWQRAPMYLNPYFFLTISLLPPKELYPEWVRSAVIFLGIGLVSSVLTMWNLHRSGENC